MAQGTDEYIAAVDIELCRKYGKQPPSKSDQLVYYQNTNQTLGNISDIAFNLTTHGGLVPKDLNHFVSFEWFEIVIPIVCLFGILGNILNLAVLTRRRHVSGMDSLGRTANCGMVALALSDLLFCFTVFPVTFITSATARSPELKLLALYYKLYGIASINLFIMISTWLIVTMAIKRYLVVAYPLHARDIITLRRTFLLIVLVYSLSAVITLPYYLHLLVAPCYSPGGATEYEYRPRWSSGVTAILKVYIRWVWPVIADFIPVIILIVCNYRLIKELKSAKQRRQNSCPGQQIRDSGQRITLILVVIVLMLLILVSPSEMLKYIDPYRAWGKTGYIVASVANVLQTINFAVNFLLYFAVSSKFRKTAKSLFTMNCSEDDDSKKSDIELQKIVHRNSSVRTTRSTLQSYGTEV